MNNIAPAPGITAACRVVDVHDGDTLTVEIVRRVHVRLLDCWAPEVNRVAEKVAGLAAKRHLQTIADGRDAMLFVPTSHANDIGDVTSMGRVLGRLFVSGQDVSELMVSAGHATKEKRK